MAAGALVVYPTAIRQRLIGVNIATAAIIRDPAVADGINTVIGGALVVGAVTGGLGPGLAIGAALAATYFLAAIFVMKIALTAMLCVLLISGALVLALWPLPQGEPLVRLWGMGLLAAVAIPVAWALVFAVAALVASDALVGDGLGTGLAVAVKPFVAVACVSRLSHTGFVVAQARLVGLRVSPFAGRQAAPGQTQLARTARAHALTHADRFRDSEPRSAGQPPRAPARSRHPCEPVRRRPGARRNAPRRPVP
jgi:hypothetical protein